LSRDQRFLTQDSNGGEARAATKVKQFLSTLIQFGSDISQGPILQHSISADNFSHKFSSSNFAKNYAQNM
jgi:hypothetical protein